LVLYKLMYSKTRGEMQQLSDTNQCNHSDVVLMSASWLGFGITVNLRRKVPRGADI